MKRLWHNGAAPAWRKGLGPVLLLVLVVVTPSICLLWFMGQAVQNERLAARQKLTEAYRGHLAVAQERLEVFCRRAARELEDQAPQAGPVLFARQALADAADAVIYFDAAGRPVYPAPVPPAQWAPPSAAWQAISGQEETEPLNAAMGFEKLAASASEEVTRARALQAAARCLIRAGQRQAAVALLLGPMEEPSLQRAADPQGRLIVPNAELLVLELLGEHTSANGGAALAKLQQRLTDYEQPGLAAPQRRFIMHELLRLFPGEVRFPTLSAEDLAASYLEASSGRAAVPGLRAAPVAGVWELGSENCRAIALHRTENLARRLQAAASPPLLPAELTFVVLPPGPETEKPLLSAPAGSLPGWRLGLLSRDPAFFEAAAHQRIAYYLWSGVLVVTAVVALGLLAMRLVRRQWALTQLRNDLVANVTHELKTPLASMRLLVDTLLDTEKLHEPTVREYLQLIARENARLSRLIDNFLAFSRMERNKRAFDFKPADPAAIVDAARAAVAERFQAADCRFEVVVPETLPQVAADADALVTAVVNLLDNAFKYTGDMKLITLSAGAAAGSVFFSVRDNGIGVSPRDTRRIFKRFYQVDQRLSRTGGGCGLGLSIVKFIVTAHHGRVEVQSEPNRGSTFTIFVPALSEPTEPEETYESQKTVDCGR